MGSSAGVTSTRSGNECVVKFTNVGSTTWNTPAGVTKVRALVVGGGASGNRGIYGVYYGAGGGGGEVKDLSNLSVGSGAKTVTVGAGGQGVLAADNTVGSSGTLSQFDSTQARPGQPANNTRTNNAGTIGGTSGSGFLGGNGTTDYGDPILVSPSANLTTSVLVSSIDGSRSGATDGNTDTASFRSGTAVFRTATFRTAAVSPSPSPSPSATTAPVTGYSVKVVTVTSAPELAPTSTDYVTEGVHLGVATPSEPRSLGSDVDDIGGKKINLAWVTPESDGGEAITGYRVRIEGGAETQTIEIDDETLNYTISEVQAGRTYVIKIAALNVNGAGAEATVTEIIPAPPAPPVTPTTTPTPSPTPEETESPRPVKPSPKPSPTDGTGNGGQKPVDTDNDGIENNEDSDIDGDGIPNGTDPDMDGDGILNGEDPDPTDTTGATEKPEANEGNGDGSAGGVITNAVTGLALFLGSIWPWVLASALLMLIGVLWIKRRQNASRD
ncbi:fibronectin type III domain-containing protein [Rhodoluna sp. KAS3]|uniref:fibronectin type III domain-containing protein n=1 Tax=Rhodoluna sp. KAS3 TaxID=942880 RepID=UPI002232A3EC|nr:fibronectin type III domain-containing protein [Rhodoluna sp. KAS3]